MNGESTAHVIGALTTPLWVLLAFYVVWLLRKQIPGAVGRLTGLEAFGLKLALSGGEAMDAAIELAEKNPNWPVEVSAADRKAAIDRANAHRSVFEGAEILWVDDVPSNNRNESRMLRSFGALITFAATTDEALAALRTSVVQNKPFHIIISDIGRGLSHPEPTGGLLMLPRLREAGFHQPVIYYIGTPKPDAGVPPGAFGLTHRPDDLLQLVTDALSRVRG
jgi:CheY-like chemotaxis protein